MSNREINIGEGFLEVIKNLSNEEINKLLKFSKNVIDKAAKAGFPVYVNLRNYKWGDIIEIVVKHSHDNPENSIEYEFMNSFEYKKERGVKITDKLQFDVTTGTYDGEWDESTINIYKYYNIIEQYKYSHPSTKMKDGGSIKSNHKIVGSGIKLEIIPKIKGHDMIAECSDCKDKFSYQKSKSNILWECPNCLSKKHISTLTVFQ